MNQNEPQAKQEFGMRRGNVIRKARLALSTARNYIELAYDRLHPEHEEYAQEIYNLLADVETRIKMLAEAEAEFE